MIETKLPATQIQLLALIFLSLLYPLMSKTMPISMSIYHIVEEGSHLYIFSALPLAFGAVTFVCGYRNKSW